MPGKKPAEKPAAPVPVRAPRKFAKVVCPEVEPSSVHPTHVAMKIEAGERYTTNGPDGQITVEALEETPKGWRVKGPSRKTIIVVAKQLRLASVGRFVVDPSGAEFERVGVCNGPRVVFHRAGDEPDPTFWVSSQMSSGSLPDEVYEAILEKPSRAHLFEDPEKSPVDPRFIRGFRSGCRSPIFIPSEELDGQYKGVRCRRCGSIAGFHGTPPKGTKAYDAQEKAAKKARKK